MKFIFGGYRSFFFLAILLAGCASPGDFRGDGANHNNQDQGAMTWIEKYNHSNRLPDPCGELGDCCHAPSRDIWEDFLTSTGLDGMSLLGAYCGTCFHEARYHDPYFPHRGVVLIAQKDGKRYFDALFSFYAGEDYCSGQSVDTARSRLIHTLYAADHEINWNRKVAWVLLNTGVERDHITYYIGTAGFEVLQ